MKKIKDLDYLLINTRTPLPEQRGLCEKAYHFWHDSWMKTFNDLGVKERQNLFADDFLDREVGVLSFKGEPIGLFFNNWFDLSRDSIVNHTYFKNYPQELITSLRKEHSDTVMVLTYMTVSEDWRRKETDLPISELLFSLGVKRFEHSRNDALIGYIRTDQKTHEIFYRHGGKKVFNSKAYNVGVDYCVMTKDSMQLSSIPGVALAADKLWQKMNSKQKIFKRSGSMNNVVKAFEDNLPRLENAFVNFPWEDKNAYCEYLGQTYEYIQHSTKLLAYAAENTLNEEFKECLLHHVNEEKGHENWAKNDLKALGSSVDEYIELRETTTLYDEIYKGIEKYGPAPIVGYSLALEGVSAKRCPEIAQRLIKTYGARCTTLIKNHGDIDQDHMKDAFEVLRFFKEEELQIVEEFLVKSVNAYIKYLDALVKFSKVRGQMRIGNQPSLQI